MEKASFKSQISTFTLQRITIVYYEVCVTKINACRRHNYVLHTAIQPLQTNINKHKQAQTSNHNRTHLTNIYTTIYTYIFYDKYICYK